MCDTVTVMEMYEKKIMSVYQTITTFLSEKSTVAYHTAVIG
jgi:hypothetical protein